MKNKRVVIISGGKIEDYNYIKNQIGRFKPDMIICADSGYNHAVKMDLKADLVVGDFDSLEAGMISESIKTVHFPARKNLTDSEIALLQAREAGAREVLFIGATGSRADHSLTNIFMLKSCLSHGITAEITDEHNRIKITESEIVLTGEAGDIISLVPLCDCAGVSTEGLEYPLENAELKLGEGRGVSNIMLGEKARVSLREGTLLVIAARD